ncbi:lamin tail domain-containing protein [Candidatus Woesearchaeota archaeon]|nr:lamin tail domain-containing protein [Candidatus Woesearchaeota archaeon]
MRTISFLLLLSHLVVALDITEVMYNPSDGDEWIEIHNEKNVSIDLTAWKLSDTATTDEIKCCGTAACSLQISPFQYLVIADQDSTLNVSHLCVDDNSIGNGLGNTGDTINLSNGTVQIIFVYNPGLGANGNNKSLEKNKKGEWKESLAVGGTPGKQNSNYEASYDFSLLEITEIMPDPFGNDDDMKPGGEWVELYNHGSAPLVLDGLYLYDSYDDHELKITDVNTFNGTLLCGKCYTVVYRDGDSDFGLNNDADDRVRLATGYPLSGHTIFRDVSFVQSTEGMSWNIFDGQWFRSAPTPGAVNVYTGGCDWELSVEMNDSLSNSSEFSVAVQRRYGIPQIMTVRGLIEDYFGIPIKEYAPWTNEAITTSSRKSYSPHLAEGVYQLRFWISNLSCTDDDFQNNNLSRLFAINPRYNQKQSTLSIEKVYLGNDNQAEWGDQISARVNVYKGDETKQELQLYAEKDGGKASKTTAVNLADKYQYYTLTLPLQLEPNCDGKIAEGKADIMVEAFGLKAQQSFTIHGIDKNVCKEIEVEKKSKSKAKESIQFLDLPASIQPGQILRLKAQIHNPDDIAHRYAMYAYLYRGSKCYSCADSARNESRQIVTVQPQEARVVDFLLKTDGKMDDGEYHLKLKYKKDELKTEKEVISSIYIQKENQTVQQLDANLPTLTGQEEEKELPLFSEKKQRYNGSRGITVYETTDERAKGLLPYILLMTLGLLIFVLLKKNM